MVNRYNLFEDSQNNEAQWDLRQFRAQLIARNIMEIEEASREFNYPSWARNIRLLFKTVEHFVTPKVKDFEDNFNEKLKELSVISNKNKSVFFGRSNDAELVWELEQCLIELERIIYKGMETSGLWGSKKDDSGGL